MPPAEMSNHDLHEPNHELERLASSAIRRIKESRNRIMLDKERLQELENQGALYKKCIKYLEADLKGVLGNLCAAAGQTSNDRSSS